MCFNFFAVFTCFCNVKGTLWTSDNAPCFIGPQINLRVVTWSSKSSKISPLQRLLKHYTSPTVSLVVSSLDVMVAFRKFTLETNEIETFVDTVNFVMVCVNKLYKNELKFVNVEFLDGRDTLLVLKKKRNNRRNWLFECSQISSQEGQIRCLLITWSQFQFWIPTEETLNVCCLVCRLLVNHVKCLVGRQNLFSSYG